MQSAQNFAGKNRISQAIFTGAIVMLLFFVVSLFLPKEWQVSGKIVVFPSGQPATASATLLPETYNTAEIVKSDTFQKNYFPDQAVNFAGAKVLKNSSMVLVKFRSSENDIQAYEDLVVKIPSQVNEYARDLYGGSPFKYKMAGDPEISASPVRPNLLLNAIFGFLVGVAGYLLYWYFLDFARPGDEEIELEMKGPSIVSPEIKPEKSAKSASLANRQKVGEGKVVMENGRPAFKPGKKSNGEMTAPENLPVAGASPEFSEVQEPSDEEVKDRLNRLMRGEL